MIKDTEAMKAVAEGITIEGIIKYIEDHSIEMHIDMANMPDMSNH